MSYEVSKVTNDLIVTINEILDETVTLIDDRFFQIGLDDLKVGQNLMKPIYSKVEDMCEELVNEGGAGEVSSSDIQDLIDKTLIERVKAATTDFSDKETFLMLDMMKLETEPSNLPAEINVEKYNRLKNEIMVADNLQRLARSYKTKSIVQISFMLQDQAVYDEELLNEDEPIRATFRFSLDINERELYSYVDIDYEIDRNTFVATRLN